MPPPNSDKKRQNNLDNAVEYTVRFERDLTYTVDSADNMKYDENFDRIWGFGGEDIFCSCDNETCFEMKNDEILLCDWLGNHYALDHNGTVLRKWQ